MTGGISIAAATEKKKIAWLFIWVALFIVAFTLHKPGYMRIRDLYFWTGVISLPFSFSVNDRDGSLRMLWPALFFGLLTIPFTTTFGVYCMLVFCLLYIIEQFAGKTSLLFALHLFLLSPLFEYLSNLVSFPIRLFLSGISGKILAFAGFDVVVSGNLIQLNGSDFLVDSACAGLYMLRYSFLVAVLILARIRTSGQLRARKIILLLAGLLALNMAGNLIRIVILVVFNIMPGHWLHDALGLVIFLFYIVLPFYYAAVISSEKKAAVPHARTSKIISARFRHAMVVFLFALFIGICFLNGTRTAGPVSVQEGFPEQYQFEKVGEIFKLTTDKALIYIKPPVEAYNANHNPLICWKGSGYSFTHVGKLTIKGLEVPMAELARGNDKLYTVWWFESGKHRTGSQWDWRYQSLIRNEDFCLINITAADMDQLLVASKVFMDHRDAVFSE